VDEVGEALSSAPAVSRPGERVVRPAAAGQRVADITSAPMDHRDAFVLSHVHGADGATSVQALVDVTGMREDEVVAILDRLARLGIVAHG